MQLIERPNDVRTRAKAKQAFGRISALFNQLHAKMQNFPEGAPRLASFNKSFGNPSTGYFGIDLRRHRLGDVFPGQLHFTPQTGTERAGLGRDRAGVPVMRFYARGVSKKKHQEVFPQFFNTRWSGMKPLFVHEYAHWLDELQQGGRRSSSRAKKAADVGDYAAYINTPEEMQAHFIEVTRDFADNVIIINNTPPKNKDFVRRHMLGDNLHQFLEKAKAKLDFWNDLTPQNKRRMLKRLAGAWAELRADLDERLFERQVEMLYCSRLRSTSKN